MPPSLSLMALTKNGSWRLERMLRSVSGKVSEIAIGIDSATDDNTEERVRRYTPNVFKVRNPEGYIEPHIRSLFERCTGDWILRLDDDEVMSCNFSIDAIPPEVFGSFDLIGFPRAWVVQRDPPLYISTSSHRGEFVPQFRMMKRSARWDFVSEIHTPGFKMKPAHVVPDMLIFHMNLVDHSVEERRIKFDFYQGHKDAAWNRTYLLDPKQVAASGEARLCQPEMFPPLDLLRSEEADFLASPVQASPL
jgi:hypothetical protein